MENNNSNINEKEIQEILNSFEREYNQLLQNKGKELEQVKFYKDFEIKGMFDADISGIFITKERDSKGNEILRWYYGSPSNEILSIDKDGTVQISEEWKKVIGEVNIEKTLEINENDEKKLKGISEKAEPEKKEAYEDNEEQDVEQVQADLLEQNEDLEITEYTKIKDSYIHEKMPEVFEDGKESGIAYSNKLNKYIIVTKENGHFQVNEAVEPARSTIRTIISIDENGKKVERKIPYAVMEISNNDDKEIAVTKNQYGEVDIETVNVLPCQERVARAVRTGNEGIEKEESLEMRTETKTQGKDYEHNLAHGVKKAEEMEKNQGISVDYKRTEDDYIPNTDKTWGELMEETGESLPKLLERYDNEMKGQGVKSEDAVKTIEEDYERLPGQRQI